MFLIHKDCWNRLISLILTFPYIYTFNYLIILFQRKTRLPEYEKYHSLMEGTSKPWYKYILCIILMAEYLSILILAKVTRQLPTPFCPLCVSGWRTFFVNGNLPVLSPFSLAYASSFRQPASVQPQLLPHINQIFAMRCGWWNVNDLIAKAGGGENCAGSPDQFPSLYFHKSFYV